MRVYAATNQDARVRDMSTSGGVFLALCESTIQAGGAVYGACFSDDMTVVHERSTSMDGCRRFSGSKYVQSRLGDVFMQVRDDLLENRRVLFSGTPCQVAGLQSYLESERASGDLLAVDLICHGVPSPQLWADHVALVSSAHGVRLRGFRFREKSVGWHGINSVAMTGGEEIVDYLVGAFGELYAAAVALRPSCHACVFANMQRVGDITLGDFWGIEKCLPERDCLMGVSIVLVSTPHGDDALRSVAQRLDLDEVTVSGWQQPSLCGPTLPSPKRSAFWKTYSRLGYEKAIKRFTSYGLLRRLVRTVRRSLKRRQR